MIVIPDVHGRVFWRQAVNDYLGKESIIFLGDYLDPYDLSDPAPVEIVDRLNSFWLDLSKRPLLLNMLADIPYSRWGNSPYGSPVWNGVGDMVDNLEEVPGFVQVFGHTQQTTRPVIKEHYMCLDVRCAFRLSEEQTLPVPVFS